MNALNFLAESKCYKYIIDAEYDYDAECPCDEDPEICANDYCRCRRISNQRITNVKGSWSLAENIAGIETVYSKDINNKYIKIKNPPNTNPILLYCIERILVSSNFYNEDNWEIGVEGGYYGEEIGDITPSEDLVTEINLKLKNLQYIEDDSERIKFILTLEYGCLLEELKDLTFSLEEVAFEQIKPG